MQIETDRILTIYKMKITSGYIITYNDPGCHILSDDETMETIQDEK